MMMGASKFSKPCSGAKLLAVWRRCTYRKKGGPEVYIIKAYLASCSNISSLCGTCRSMMIVDPPEYSSTWYSLLQNYATNCTRNWEDAVVCQPKLVIARSGPAASIFRTKRQQYVLNARCQRCVAQQYFEGLRP